MDRPDAPGERKRYAKKIPVLTMFLSVAKACRFWYLSCGAVFSQVDATTRKGAETHVHVLQPALAVRRAHRDPHADGCMGVSPRRFGFDIQVRQDGRLIARYQRAGVCAGTCRDHWAASGTAPGLRRQELPTLTCHDRG